MSRTASLVAVLIVSLGLVAGKSAGVQYHQTREIHADLEYFSQTALDSAGGRLFIASKRGVFTYDLTSNRLGGKFSDAKEARLAIAPDLGRCLVASPGSVALLDLADGHTIGSAAISGRPSAVLYDRERHEFYVDRLTEDRRDIFVFDRDGRQIRRLSGFEDWGMAALAPRGRLLILGENHISVVKTDSGETSTWTLDRRSRSYKLAVDSDDDRVFVSVEGHIVMLDGTTGARLASMPTNGAFVFGYDGAGRRLLYGWSANDDVYIAAVDIRGDRFVPVQQIRVPRDVYDVQFDPAKAGFMLAVSQPQAGTFRRLMFELR